MNRRGILGLGACFGVGALFGARLGLPEAFAPGRPRAVTGPAAALVEEAFRGIDPAKMWDAHVHVCGIGTDGSGCWVNPKTLRVTSPWRSFKFDVYRRAAGITDLAHADRQYVERLLELSQLFNPKGRLVAYAFDYSVDEAGSERPEASDFYVPNEYVFGLAKKHPRIVPCASIHPYRSDALERLAQAAGAGAVAVKWLPNSQGMDPASTRCHAFYARLAELGLPLITHGGEELAVDAPDLQELGNPLRLRPALEHGVKVVVAHCASLGRVQDLDSPSRGLRLSAFDAFMRLFNEARYDKLLFGDISAVTQFHRVDAALKEILIDPAHQKRLVNGSDYPLPCIDPLISTWLLVRQGFLTQSDRKLLNEIYQKNPLLFDFVLKRRVSVEFKNRTHLLSPSVFETSWLFERDG